MGSTRLDLDAAGVLSTTRVEGHLVGSGGLLLRESPGNEECSSCLLLGGRCRSLLLTAGASIGHLVWVMIEADEL